MDDRYEDECNGKPDDNDNSNSNSNPTTSRPTLIPVTTNPIVGTSTTAATLAVMPARAPFYPGAELNEDPVDDFMLQNAQGRLLYICHALLVLEENCGAVDRWLANFAEEWLSVRANGAHQVALWFCTVRKQVQKGWHLIRCLARVMDGEMPTVDEWQSLWLEAYQLLGMIYAGVVGLEQKLELVERSYGVAHIDHIQLQSQLIV